MNCKIRGHLRFIEINQSHNSCQHTQVDFLISIPNALADQVQSEFMSDVRVLTEKIVEMSPASLFQRFIFKFREVPGIHRCAPGPQTVIGCVTAVDVSISSSVIVAPVKPAPPKPKTRSGGLNITKKHNQTVFLEQPVHNLRLAAAAATVTTAFNFCLTGQFFHRSLQVMPGKSPNEETLGLLVENYFTGWIPFQSPKQQCQSSQESNSLSLSLSLSVRFNGHFPGEPGLASAY